MMHSILQVELHHYFPSALKNDSEVIKLHSTSTAYTSNPCSWFVAKFAKAISDLCDIMKKSSTMVARDQSNLPPPITKFISFIEGVL